MLEPRNAASVFMVGTTMIILVFEEYLRAYSWHRKTALEKSGFTVSNIRTTFLACENSSPRDFLEDSELTE